MITGTIAAMATPFDSKGALDTETAQRLAVWLVERGVDAVFVGGTTGEGLLLSLDERKRLTEAVVKAVGGRGKVLSQVGCANTADSIVLARHAMSAGVDGIVALSPFFFSVDNAAMVSYFAAIAAAAPETPIYLYNIPGNTRNPISTDVVRELLDKAPNLAGMKDSSKDLVLLQKFVKMARSGFAVLVGSDSVLLPGLAVGAVGGVSAAATVFPEAVVAVVRAFGAGDLQAAQAAQQHLNKLLSVLKIGPTLAGYKVGLALRGMPIGGMRPPLRDFAPEESSRFQEAFSAAWN